jgi:hypothetical protein
MDPNNTSDLYKKSAADTVTPEQTAPPLKSTFTGTLSNPVRGANTAFTGTVGDPTPIGDDQPQKLVMTLPEAVSIDVDALGTVCTLVQRQNADCPDASQVGTATISTPLISAGLTGKVYMTTSSNKSLPNLSIFATGAIKFRLDATTRFVGPNSNQIETTLDNLPQNVFTNFTVTISGGNNSLLLNRSCPTDGSAPAYGGTTSTLSGYAGNTTSATSNNTFDGCYGVNKPSKLSHCVKQSKKLKVSPKGLIDTGNIAKIDLLTGTKSTNQHTRSTVKKSPFKFNLTLKKSKYKKNKKYYYAYKVTYKPTSDAPSGKTIKTGSGTFKTCK